ncbi:MAG TPA: MATE family efflux transporter, partial [Tepidisphaeraceae bacterium]
MPTLDYERPAAVSPLRELLTLAIPTVLQMSAYTLEQFCDTYMLAQVSDDFATAAGQGGMLAFAVLSFGFGVMMLINAMVSQSFGADKKAECGRYLWQGIWFAVAYSVAVVPLIFIAAPVFTWMGHDERLIPLEVDYFNVSVYMIVVKMLAMALGQFLLAINRPNVVLAAAAVGVVSNVFVNWLLITGNWGFPALGVAGAAWGTNAAMTTELLIVGAFVFAPKIRRAYSTLQWRPETAKLKELLRHGVPSGLQISGDVISWTIFFGYVMAFYGTATLAANNYAMQYVKIAFMPAWGFSSAVTAIVGRYVGAGDPDTAMQRAALGLRITMTYMVSLGIALLIFQAPLMRVFTADAETLRVARIVLICCSGFMVFDAMFMIYMGALRGVKDTFWPMVVQLTLVWTLVVCGGLAAAVWFTHWGPSVPW